MKIVVLVKHVPDATGERGFAADGTVDRAAVDGLLSELDEYAVEQALQLAEDGDDVEVVAHDAGPDDAADAIKRSLQMGASAGIHINDDAVHGSDALATSAVLAAAIRKAAPDLVLCGMASTDGSMGVLPSMIAERLGWPAATFGADADRERRHGHDPAGRRRGQPDRGGRPAGSGQCDRPVREARYPSMKGILAAKKKPVEALTLADLDVDPGAVGLAAAWSRWARPIRGRPRSRAGWFPTRTGGAAALVEFLAAGKYI